MAKRAEPFTEYRSTKKWERLLDRFGDFGNVLYCTTLWVVINIVILVILMNENTSTLLSGAIRVSVMWNLIFYFPTLLVVVCIRAVEMVMTKLFKRVEILFKRFFFRSLGIAAILILTFILLTAIDTMGLSFLTNLSLNSVILCTVLYLYSVVYCLMMKR